MYCEVDECYERNPCQRHLEINTGPKPKRPVINVLPMDVIRKISTYDRRAFVSLLNDFIRKNEIRHFQTSSESVEHNPMLKIKDQTVCNQIQNLIDAHCS